MALQLRKRDRLVSISCEIRAAAAIVNTPTAYKTSPVRSTTRFSPWSSSSFVSVRVVLRCQYCPSVQSRIFKNAHHAGSAVSESLLTAIAYTHGICYACSSGGPRKAAIDSVQNQIEFDFGEIKKLRSAHNSHVPVSGLPAELLSEVFLWVVRSSVQDCSIRYGLQGWIKDDDPCFGIGTFGFRQVCKHWNEVAIGSPKLWVWWFPGATEAWPLFYERSRGAPISLFWRDTPTLVRYPNILKDPTLPKRTRLLDFRGENQHFEYFLRVFDPIPPFNASSIQLNITPYHAKNPEDHLVRFFSLSFPKLSSLDIRNFLPDPSSPVFMTSNLTSLRLSFPFSNEPHYTLAEFSKTLQRHPNLRKLDLEDGAMPRVEPSGVPVSFVLSQLTDLKLCGMVDCVSGLIDLIGMSPPLLDVVLRFRHPRHQIVPPLFDPVKKILGAYYGRTEPDRARKAVHLMVEQTFGQDRAPIAFVVKSSEPRPAPAPSLQSSLRLELWWAQEVFEFFHLFPLENVKTFSANRLSIYLPQYRTILQKMEHLMHLNLTAVNVNEVIAVIDHRYQGTLEINTMTRGQVTYTHADEPAQPVVPKLAYLTLSHLDFLYEASSVLLTCLQGRRAREVGLKRLVIRSCRVHSEQEISRFKKVVEEVEWSDLEEIGSGYEDSGLEDTDCELGGYDSDYGYDYYNNYY